MGSILVVIAALLAGGAIGVLVSQRWDVSVGVGISIGLLSLLLSVWGYAQQHATRQVVESWIRIATSAYTDSNAIEKSLKDVEAKGQVQVMKAHIASLLNGMTGFLGMSREEMRIPHVVVFDVGKSEQ